MAWRNQEADVRRFYDERSSVYDHSWHSRFARHMTELLDIKPGQHVLDLACGTGLMTFRESTAVGPSGSVVGIDMSSGMLGRAEAKKSQHDLQNVSFHSHSITDLDPLEAIKGKRFDLITCVSALVLLPQPEEAVKQWVSYLKPGGRFMVDVTHPQSHLAGITFERVGNSLGRPVVASYRLRFQTPDDLQQLMEDAGLTDVSVKLVSQRTSRDGTENLRSFICELAEPMIANVYCNEDGEGVYESLATTRLTHELCGMAKVLFLKEWAKLVGPDGKIVEIDGVFVGVGTKP